MAIPALRSEASAEARPIHVPAHGNGVLRPFQPGQSGNPSGKGGLYLEAQRICREASPAAARRMVELMSSTDERVALMAADKVLERAWGKPKEMPDDVPADPAVAEKRERSIKTIIDLLQLAAVPAPLPQGEADQGQSLPGQRATRRVVAETDPPPPDKW